MDRWDRLFAHLEAEQELNARDIRSGTADQVRQTELRHIRTVDRLRSHRGESLRIIVEPGDFIEGNLLEVHQEWILLTGSNLAYVVASQGVVAYLGLTSKVEKLQEADHIAGATPRTHGLTAAGQDAMNRLKAKSAVSAETSLVQKIRDIALGRKRILIQAGSSRFEGVIMAVFSDHLTINAQIKGREAAKDRQNDSEISIPLEKLVWLGVPSSY